MHPFHKKGYSLMRKPNSATAATSASVTSGETLLVQVVRLINAEDYRAAVALLRETQRKPHLRNALGICLLRTGKYEEAVRVYRDLVLAPGCTWMTRELPVEFKLNFATALLLYGSPSGCRAILAELGDDQHPTVIKLRAAISAWERTLPWWSWLDWKFCRVDPSNRPVRLEFLPGEFAAVPPVEEPRPVRPTTTRRNAA